MLDISDLIRSLHLFGLMCMDQMMVDVTSIPAVEYESEVVLICKVMMSLLPQMIKQILFVLSAMKLFVGLVKGLNEYILTEIPLTAPHSRRRPNTYTTNAFYIPNNNSC